MRIAYWSSGLLAVAAIAAIIHFLSPHLSLRIATDPNNPDIDALMRALQAEIAVDRPRVQLRMTPFDSLAGVAKAIEDGKADVAVVRSDISAPTNGQTVAVIRRDPVAFILPPGSPIDNIGKLAGKTVAIQQGHLQQANADLMDLVLAYYNVKPKDVQRVFLDHEALVTAVRRKRVAAIFAVGPVGPGDAATAVSAMASGSGGTPTMLEIDQADSFIKQHPAFESFELPEGGWMSRPALPDDATTTIAVSYRLVVPRSMLDLMAGGVSRFVFKRKAKLATMAPIAAQIEAPDLDDKTPLMPVHPGVADYLNNGDETVMDTLQTYFYAIAAAGSVGLSLMTIIVSRLRTRRMLQAQGYLVEFIRIAQQAREASMEQLAALEQALHQTIDRIIASRDPSRDPTNIGIAINHARYSIERRRSFLQGLAALEPGKPLTIDHVAEA